MVNREPPGFDFPSRCHLSPCGNLSSRVSPPTCCPRLHGRQVLRKQINTAMWPVLLKKEVTRSAQTKDKGWTEDRKSGMYILTWAEPISQLWRLSSPYKHKCKLIEINKPLYIVNRCFYWSSCIDISHVPEASSILRRNNP